MSTDLDRPTDPLMDQLGAANPISERSFAGAALPPLGPLPARAPSPTTRRRLAAGGALSMAIAVGVAVVLALTPASAPGGDQLLQRALAAGSDGAGPAILHWRSRIEQSGIESATDDAYMHVTADGDVDVFHQLRVDGTYKGNESVVTQPHGIGNLTGANDRTRRGPDQPIRESPGYGLPNFGFAAVVGTVLSAADGHLAASAEETTYDGRAAWAVTIRDNKHNPMVPGPDGTPARPSVVTVWIGRSGYTPLAVRYADDRDRTFLVEKVLAFERLPDDAEHQRLLDFAPAG